VKFLVIDKGLGPVASLKESWRITKGSKWELFILIIVLAVLNLLGAIALLIGLFITIPVTALATVHAYRTLEHKAGEMTPAAPAA